MTRLKNTVTGLVPVTPTDSKEARAWAVQPLLEAGNCWLPAIGFHQDGRPILAPWVEAFISEHAGFPRGKDDQVDTTTQALIRFMQRKGTENVPNPFA